MSNYQTSNPEMNQCLATIKNATLGEEVREAIIRAIKLCYEDVIENVAKGDDGLSAYQLAVQNGYSGTVTEWLGSLIGPEGPEGPEGPAGHVDIENLQIQIDNELSSNSENPVQNKVIKAALDNKMDSRPFSPSQARKVLVVGTNGNINVYGSKTYGEDTFNQDVNARSMYIPSEKSVSNYTYSKLESDNLFLKSHQDISGKANVGDSYTKNESDDKYLEKTNIDDELSSNSENPIQNKVIKAALDNITPFNVQVDDEFDDSSENPVQNKVIKAALDDKVDNGDFYQDIDAEIDNVFSTDNPNNDFNNWNAPSLIIERIYDQNTNKYAYYLVYIDSECTPSDSEIGGAHWHRIANLSSIFETDQNKINDLTPGRYSGDTHIDYPTTGAVISYVGLRLVDYARKTNIDLSLKESDEAVLVRDIQEYYYTKEEIDEMIAAL